MRIELSQQARRDIRAAVEHMVADDARDAARSFVEAVNDEMRIVADAPLRWREVRTGLRAKPFAKPWPYSLLYAIEPREVVVLAVAHHRRRPGYWR